MLKITKYSANFCKPCKTIEKTMDEILPSYNTSVDYRVVDIDENIELADEMQIRNVPTMIFEKNGKIVLRFTGTRSGNEIKKLIDQYIY